MMIIIIIIITMIITIIIYSSFLKLTRVMANKYRYSQTYKLRYSRYLELDGWDCLKNSIYMYPSIRDIEGKIV